MAKIKIAGLDGSLRNFGAAFMTLDTETMELVVDDLHLVKTEKSKEKQVRKSSDNLLRAQQIQRDLFPKLKNCAAAFIEVPYGGQSYDAVLGFGIVIGIYSCLPIPVVEVSPSETKMAAVGTKTASKEEMIEWAAQKYPDAPWLTVKRKGVMVPTKNNEHLADSVAIAHAGILTPTFRQTIAILQSQAA